MVLPKNKENKPKNVAQKKSKSKKNIAKSSGKKGKSNILKPSRISASDGICMSKQLAAKIKRQPRTNNSAKTKSGEPRLCGNGKPMPSLAELEKMYEDTDDEDDNVPQPPQRSKTPDEITQKDDSKVFSPRTLEKLSNKVMEIISNLSESVVIEDGPPPIVPPKKINKSGIPYIVGCKDRPRIPEKSNKSNVGKGEKKYGVDYSLLNVKDEEDEEFKKKKRKKSEIPNPQYSTFNANSDAIAIMLRRTEQFVAKYGNAANPDKIETDSDDSNKTITYSPPQKRIRFSPIPSTSTDTEVFLKNDQNFHESLLSMGSSLSSESSEAETAGETNDIVEKDNEDTDIQIIETPIETIDVDDVTNQNINQDDKKHRVNNSPDFEIIETSTPVTNNKRKIEEIFEIEDEYERIDVDKLYQSSVDDCEIIDIDELIAQNNSLMEKYQKNTRDCVITVPDVSFHHSNVTNSTPKSVLPPKTPVISVEPTREHSSNSVVIVSETKPNQKPKKMSANRVLQFTERNNASDSIIFVPSTNCNQSNIYRTPDSVVSSTIPVITDILSYVPVIPTPSAKSVSSSSPITPQKKERECPICMESISKKPPASTLCGHIFCMECIKAAIKSSGKKCPTCRKKLTGIGYHPLFL